MSRIVISLRLLLAAVMLVTLTVFTGCGGGSKKSAQDNRPRQIAGEGQTREQVAGLDSAEKPPLLALSNVVLADGRSVQQILNEYGSGRGRQTQPLTPQDYKARAVAQMIERARELCDRSLWQIAAGGTNQPVQDGLAYSYGSKDPDIRQRPPAGYCQDEVHGLDCSGLVYQSANSAGIKIPVGTAAIQGTAATWNVVTPTPAIPTEWRVKMKSLDLTTLANGYETGDIICWGSHIGIVLVDGLAPGGLYVLQSNGSSGSSNAAENTLECHKNHSRARGPNMITMHNAIRWCGTPTSVLRLIPDAQFTIKLTWGAQPDVDLHVDEPNGAHVYFGHKQGVDGYLDLDDTSQYGPEHYFVQRISDGDYRVGVAYYRGEGPETARITIIAGSETRNFDQVLTSTTGTTPTMVATIRVSTDATSGERKIQILDARGSRAVHVPYVDKDTLKSSLP